MGDFISPVSNPARLTLLVASNDRYVDARQSAGWRLKRFQCLAEACVFSPRELRVRLHVGHLEVVSAGVGALLAWALGRRAGLLLHGAFLLRDERAYLLLGESGAGKSTLARNAVDYHCVHDDKVAVRRIRGRWWAYGVPILDNHGRPGRNRRAPVAGLYFIEKSRRFAVEELNRRSVLRRLPGLMIVPEFASRPAVFDTMLRVAAEVASHRLRFRKDSRLDGEL